MSPSNSKRRKATESHDEDSIQTFSSGRKKSRNNRKKKDKSSSSSKDEEISSETKNDVSSSSHSNNSSSHPPSAGKVSILSPDSHFRPSVKKSSLCKNDSSKLDLILTGDKRRGLYECDYCRRDISQLPRIRCAVCPDFDLCLECFSTTDPSAANTSRSAAQAAMALEQPAMAEASSSAAIVSAGDGHDLSISASNNSQTTLDEKGKQIEEPGILVHDSSHGYRVADSTRFPLFPCIKTLLEKERSFIDSKAPSDASLNSSLPDTENGSQHEELNAKEEFVEDMKNVWTVEEDLRLLDAITTMGLGNWVDISEAVSGNNISSGSSNQTKSAKRCMERYFDDYLGRYGHILPPYLLVEVQDKETSENGIAKDDASTKDGSAEAGNNNAINGKRKKLRRSDSHLSSFGASAKSKKYRRIPTSSLPNYEHIWPDAYIPPIGVERGEEVGRDTIIKTEKTFVSAVSNAPSKEEAEKMHDEWVMKHTRPNQRNPVFPPRLEDIRLMKGSELAGYMPRRGDFDVEYDNDAEHILADMEFSPNDHPSERALKLQIIQIYNSKLDEREKRKKFLIDRNLLDYRNNQLEEEKLPPDERDLIQRMRLFARFHSPEEHSTFLKNLLKAQVLRKQIARLQFYRRMGITSLVEAEAYELDKRRREHHKSAVLQKEAEERLIMLKELKSSQNGVLSGIEGGVKRVDRSRRRRSSLINDDSGTEKKEEDVQEPTKEDAKPDEQMSDDLVKKNENGFDISGAVGLELLASKEIDLCKRLRLLPKYYLEAKKELIQQSLKAGMLNSTQNGSSSQQNALVKIDVEKRNGVIDFVLKCGWIPAKPSFSS